MKKTEKNKITLQQYENVKNLFIEFWGVDNKRMSKILNKTPKAFIKYINKHYDLKTTWQIVILGTDESIFVATRKTEEEAKALYNKWLAYENVKIEYKKVECLKLK